MKWTKEFLVLLAVCAVGCSVPSTPEPSGDVTAFIDVHVIPMDSERVLEHQTVVVRGDRIVELGPAGQVQVPEGSLQVEGTGKYLMPGFAEMHGHIPPLDSPREYVEAVLFLYVANGVTTVRGMLGAPNQLSLREEANSGQVISPSLYLAGPSFSGNSIESPSQAEARVREQHAAGWDLLKIHPGLTREEYDAVASTAHELGIPFAGHVPAEVGILHALEMGQETIDHLDGYIEYLNGNAEDLDPTKLEEVVTRTREAGAWVVPTMALWETLLGVAKLETLQSYPELKYMPSSQVENWVASHQRRTSDPGFDEARASRVASHRIQLLQALNEGGVKILFGTDAPQQFSVPGFSIHREFPYLLRAGMSPFEILRSGTKNVGEYFQSKDRFGTVAAGQRADLLLLDANPLEDVSSLALRSGVMVRGKWIPEEQIQERLARIAQSYR